MGTSSSYGGPKGSTPLVPSWLGGENLPPEPAGQPEQDSEPDVLSPDQAPTGVPPDLENPPFMQPDRYRQSRRSFNSFLKANGGGSGALGKAVSSYISKSSGGPRRAAQKIGSSKATTVGLVNFLNSVRNDGLEATLKNLNLGSLLGQSIEDVFTGLIEFVCPDGGSIDEGVARNAFIETIADLAQEGITDLDTLTSEQMVLVVELYATHAIVARLCNDIGTKISIAPANLPQVERAQDQLQDFIRRGVSDALESMDAAVTNLTAIDTAKFVDEIYIEAFTMLQTLGETESDQ